MENLNIYPLSEIKIKEEYSPYRKVEEIPGGKLVTLNIPHRYDIKFYSYNLVPGVSLIISDSNLTYQYHDKDNVLHYENPEDNLLINFVIDGHSQLEIGPDKYTFIKEDNINIYKKSLNPQDFSYIGKIKLLHIILNRRQIEKNTDYYNREFNDIVKELFKKVENEELILFKSTEDVHRLIKELIEYKPKNKLSQRFYYQVKVLEILLKIYEYDFKDEKINQRSYSDAQIRVVRYIKNSLSRNIASYVSLETLSASYGINLTTLKNCFRDMYGKPLYTWYKEYKFYRARELIKNTDYPISHIAHMIGYKSSSKFAKAFKKEMGVLPSSYRKNKK